MTIRSAAIRAPVLGRALRWIRSHRFQGSAAYWDNRYRAGGDSGVGSYGRLAQFKADFLNDFVARNEVESVVELGSGDGAQVALATYPSYLGVDISPVAIQACRQRFSGEPSRRFEVHEPGLPIEAGDLALSLDVIYHLVEDATFERYMRDLFAASLLWVIIYSSNWSEVTSSPHVRHRRFTDWVNDHEPGWRLVGHVPNAYPAEPHQEAADTSFADFFVYRRTSASSAESAAAGPILSRDFPGGFGRHGWVSPRR